MAIAIITDVIILLITLAAALSSGQMFLTMMAAGLMLIFVTARFMSTEAGKTSGGPADKVILSLCYAAAAAFAVITRNFIGFMIFLCIPFVPVAAVLIPSCLGFVVLELINDGTGSRQIAIMIIESLFILTAAAVILGIRYLVTRLIAKQTEDHKKLMHAGINELHERKRNREILEAGIYAEKNARLIERENISRNIHNSVGHSITAAIMTLDAADMLYDKDPNAARVKMNDAGQRIRGSLESIRSAVRALDSDSEDTSISDLTCYIDNIIDNFTMDTSIRVDKMYHFFADDMMIPAQHAEFLTGVLQELLTNGVKHGGATEFTVMTEGDSGHIKMCVRDNGRSGFSSETQDELIKNGFGLKKIISYVERYGGKASFASDDGNGFEANVEIAWQAEQAGSEE